MSTKVTLAHSGKQHAYQVALALKKLDALDIFYTSSYIKNRQLQQYFTHSQNSFWTRRFIAGLSGNIVDSNWRFEIKEQILRKIYGKTIKTQNAVYERDMAFDAYVARNIKHRKSDIFWGFQGSCYNSLTAAKKAGKITICELATAHVKSAKKILGHEAALHPEWADSIDNFSFPAHYEARLNQEPHIADYTIAASEFTRQSLLDDGIHPDKIIYLPLGFTNPDFTKSNSGFKQQNTKIKLLYAGTVTQRKGIKYLLEAVRLLDSNKIDLHIIGGIQGSGLALQPYKHLFTYHNPLSQQEFLQQLPNYDYLVLPTIFEGFGLVIVEAMAMGLPVITTAHSIGSELIDNEINGFLVPVRDINALVTTFAKILSLTNIQYNQLTINAQNTVRNFSWNHYTNKLQIVLNTIKQ